ncbi:Nn.00g038750.m01.CDS01 [Neocucurbitaria sp. VM-36]
MSPSNTAFFFVPGAFCPASYYDKVASLLKARGYSARALDLPSMDLALKDAGKTPGLYDDAKYVRENMSDVLDDLREGKDVIIVASSYGGAVTFEACNGITADERRESGKGTRSGGELKHLVLLGVLLAEPGPTVKELVGANVPVDTDSRMPNAATHIDAIDPTIAGAVLCGSLPREEQEYYGAMGKSICAQAFNEPLTFAAWEKVPTTLIIGDKDLALAPEKQHEYFDKAVEKGVPHLKKVVIEGGDHLPMLSDPEEVVKVCLEAAGDA